MIQTSKASRRIRWTGFLIAIGLVAAFALNGQAIGQVMFTFIGQVHTWVSPAYSSPYVTADDLLRAATPTSGGVIFRHINTSPPGFQIWTGNSGNGTPQNFPLTQGEGYSIVAMVTENVTLQGTHVPAVIPQAQNGLPAIPILSIPPGGSIPAGMLPEQDYLVAIPWQSTLARAEDLRQSFLQARRVVRCDQVPGNPPAFFFWTGFSGNDIPQNYTLDFHSTYQVRSSVTSVGVILP